MADPKQPLTEKALAIHERLREVYGTPRWRPHMDAVSEQRSPAVGQGRLSEPCHR